jgi:hypothetical protein
MIDAKTALERTVPVCRNDCTNDASDVAVGFQQCRNGKRRIRASCVHCGAFLCWLPMREPFLSMANNEVSPTPILDVLMLLEEIGVELKSDGKACWVPYPDCKKLDAELAALIRQCSHDLARMLGDHSKITPGVHSVTLPDAPTREETQPC